MSGRRDVRELDSAFEDWLPDFCEALCGRADEDGLYSLSGPEQHIVLAYAMKGIIDNGGFRYFYEGATNADELADAYDALGLPALAEACRRSLAAFEDELPPYPQQRMFDWMEKQDEAVFAFWDELSEVVWRCEYDQIFAAISRYLHSLPVTVPEPQVPRHLEDSAR